MSASSTSKQPMLADRPYLRCFDLNNHKNDGFDPAATSGTTPVVIADQMNGDGMIIDTIELISRGGAHDVNIWLSTSNQIFRHGDGNNHGDAELILRASTTATIYNRVEFTLPKLLTPVPRVGTEAKNTGLYVPRGFCLWAAIDSTAAVVSDGPNLLIQGGVY